MNELSLSEKREFYSSLLSLYDAGFSYADAFFTIETNSRNKNIKAMAQCIRFEIQKNVPFTKIITKYKEILGAPYALLVCAGDISGKLDEVLEYILKDIKRIENFRSSLISSLIYPVLLFFGALGVLMFCQFFFFKVFDVMYTTGMDPAAMKTLFIGAILKIALVYAVISGLIVFLVINRKAQVVLLDFMSKNAILSGFFKRYFMANFFSVLAASYDAGIPVTESIFMASPLLKTKKMTTAIRITQKLLCQSESVTVAFRSAGIFDEFMLAQIATGEKTGTLEKTFYAISEQCERKLQEYINIFTGFIKPFSILVVGLLVGYIAITFYSRLYGGLLNYF